MGDVNVKRRPDRGGESEKRRRASKPSLAVRSDSETKRRREVSDRFLTRSSHAVGYGSPEWLALPEGDPDWVAAVFRAAECWARMSDTAELEAELRLEIAQMREAYKRLDDAEYVARREEHRKEWGHLRLVNPVPMSQRPEFLERGTRDE